MIEAISLNTPRLRLRELTVDDAEFVCRLVNEPSFLTNIGDRGVRTADDARRYIVDGPWTRQRKPGYAQFLVELKDNGTPIGVCGLLYREALDLSDVGFALVPEHWGKVYGTEAASAIMAQGRSALGIDRIVGLTSADNLASIKVLVKLGLSFERTVKMSDDDPGTALYS